MSQSLPWVLPLPPGRLGNHGPGAKGSAAGKEVARWPRTSHEVGRAVSQARFGEGDDDEADWRTVYVSETVEEAHVILGALDAEDIPALIVNQAMSRLIGASSLWRVEVRVPVVLEDRAREIICV